LDQNLRLIWYEVDRKFPELPKEARSVRQNASALIAIIVEKASCLDLVLDVSAASREIAARCDEPVALGDIATDIMKAGIGAGIAMCFGNDLPRGGRGTGLHPRTV
jgi:hypothetical protein